jgi:hypothetical protein
MSEAAGTAHRPGGFGVSNPRCGSTIQSTVKLALAVLVLLAALSGTAGSAPLTADEVRAWREDLAFLRKEMPARHGNLFHTMTPAQFDSALGAIDAALPRLTRPQVVVELMRLDALVGDGHSNVSPWRDPEIRFRELPIALYLFSDGVYVRAAASEHEELLGARVVEVGGVPIEDALARVHPLIGHDNAMGLAAWAPVLLTMPEILDAVGLAKDPDHAMFTLEQGGKARTVTLAPIGPYPMRTGEPDRSWMPRAGWVDARTRTPLWLEDASDLYWYRALPQERALYCQVNAIQQDPADSLEAFMARALAAADSMAAQRFVLDLRLNGGGDGQWCNRIVLPLLKSRYDVPGRLYVLMGRRTWSAAQFLLCDLEEWSRARFAGEPSASRGNHYGDSRKIPLPNSKVTVRVSTLYWQHWDPRDRREWIEPDLPAGLDFASYRDGKDPVLLRVVRD